MEEVLAGGEYPAMLASLQPGQAVQTLNERVKRITKTHNEIADWVQERRRAEDQYALSMRKLLQFKVPNGQSDLGVFQLSWHKLLESVHAAAEAHHDLAFRLERDVEAPLRQFYQQPEMTNMVTVSSNLAALARDLDDATDKSERLARRGARANPVKVDAAQQRLDAAQGAWESQAPFVFESLQALDEKRCVALRDLLTQMGTHETDLTQRRSDAVADVLAAVLEIKTDDEVKAFAQRTTAGKPRPEKRASAPRQGSSTTGTTTGPGSAAASLTVPSPGFAPGGGGGSGSASGGHEDDTSDLSTRDEGKGGESRLRRLGTMLGRRRQSVHGGFGQIPGLPSFNRGISSSHGRGASPRGSSHNLSDPSRLSSLAESPDLPNEPRSSTAARPSTTHDGSNGVGTEHVPRDASPSLINGSRTAADIFDVIAPVPERESSRPQQRSPERDAEGFTIPTSRHDPIAEAQREATAGPEDADQLIKVNIQNEPVAEEDPDAKQAAMTSVASTLSQMGKPSRKAGTIRGRRDVRNTIYMSPSTTIDLALPPAPPAASIASVSTASASTATAPAAADNNPFSTTSPSPPPMPPIIPAALAATRVTGLVSESSVAGTSDTQSVRSGNSLGSTLAHLRHPDLSHVDGLGASIIETVSATFEEGAGLTSVSVQGEIALSYAPATTSPALPHQPETIRINNFPNLGSIGPNRIFVQNVPAQPGQYKVDMSHLRGTCTAFSYRVFADDASQTALTSPTGSPIPGSPPPPPPPPPVPSPLPLARHVPLLLKPSWKVEGEKLGLLLQYGPNPACALPQPLGLQNVVIVASYSGGRAARAQTKPNGTHLGDKQLVYWRLGDLAVGGGKDSMVADAKIVCRILGVDGSGVELLPGHVEARWEYPAPPAPEGSTPPEAVASGISISHLVEGKGKGKAEAAAAGAGPDSDPFADDTPISPDAAAAVPEEEQRRWVEVPLVRKMVSGRFEARATPRPAAA